MAMATAQVRLDRVGQIAVHAGDVRRATEFYRDVLGMTFLFEIPNAAFFQCGDVRLMLSRPEAPELDRPASPLYYRVHDIRGAHQALAARGVAFEREPHLIARMPDHELWMAFFRDTEGNPLALMEERR